MSDALDSVALEAAGQLTDWIETKTEDEDGPRVRFTFIPSSIWASILARQGACAAGRDAIKQRIESGESDDISKDLHRLGQLEEQMLLVAAEVVGRSLREVEGREPLRLNSVALQEIEVESLIADGIFWPAYTAAMRVHWSEPDAIRAMFRSRLG